ncbi:unnamed protein product [Paramecium primaurelia]|uniref:non-specific serine/threonine protein kinase n=1 Tax=Paramecium primaurelia TaxID=5886 RepID=A0A8S1K2H4_PARPR|nr:unnamed protein product [Paramecium primaurelia]
MGNCSFSNSCEVVESNISIKDFDLLKILGSGSSGKVWKALNRTNKQLVAIKVMSKLLILKQGIVSLVINEKNILSQIKNPFIVNLNAAFQDNYNLYLCLDLMSGGDLRYHLNKKKQFSESQTKFFIACIFISLDYLHQQGIIHRDLKPENLVFDKQGYIRLTDFGMAGIWRPNSLDYVCGSIGYIAPEMILQKQHGIGVDYFALGIIAYECMLGKRPYEANDLKQMKDLLLSQQIQLKRSELPIEWSIEAGDFVNRLIKLNAEDRLGTNDPQEVMNHPWFKNFDWNKLISKQMNPPYVPKKSIGYSNYQKCKQSKQKLINIDILNSNQQKFAGYHFNPKKNNYIQSK